MMFDHLNEGRWWDVGLQLVEGCTKVSPGCTNCWSLTAANMRRFNPNTKIRARYKGVVNNSTFGLRWTGQVNPQWQDLDKIGRARKPQVYTFWNDLFHPGVEEEFVTEVMLRILTRPQHFYIICTKRPERALEYFNLCWPDYVLKFGPDPFKSRLMLMTTVESQDYVHRVETLLQIPGVLHGVSVEPGLGMVDLRPYLPISGLSIEKKRTWWQCVCGTKEMPVTDDSECNCEEYYDQDWSLHALDFIVCGGETGPHARPMHPDIPRKLRDDCVAAGVPFFFKSWGEWVPRALLSEEDNQAFWNRPGPKHWGTIDINGSFYPETSPWNGNEGADSRDGLFEYSMLRVGKKTAGRTLDGQVWNQIVSLKY
jgi:protein gp37